MVRIIFIGAGNLATHLSRNLQKSGFCIYQILSRTEDSAKKLAQELNCNFSTDFQRIFPDADCYFIAVNDSSISEVVENLNFTDKLMVHLSGSVSLNVLTSKCKRAGVFYPLQTFSKNKEINFCEIPIFIESNSEQDAEFLFQMAKTLSENVYFLNSEKREMLHLSAIFVNNFVNHCFTIAENILSSQNIDFQLLIPLISETFEKILTNSPSISQTGPAKRNDKIIIEKHLTFLNNFSEIFAEVYKILSQSIQKYYEKILSDFEKPDKI